MPLRSWIDDDFAAFRAGLLSLAPSVPLQLNLRAIMAPALAKLRLYSKATVAFHFFTNPSHRELHVMAIGAGDATAAVLERERQRRSEGINFLPSEDLPTYYSKVLDSKEQLERLFRLPHISRDEEYKCCLQGPLLAVLRELAQHNKHSPEFTNLALHGNDLAIVLPLRSTEYPRLGHFVLWSPGEELRTTSEWNPDREIRSTFQARMRQLIVRLFTNYYRMGPDTYLPSYYLPGRKEVTLLCAKIGGFQRIWDLLRQVQLTQEERTDVRRDLVDNFGRIASETIEGNGGRIDQNWGSGVLAVFGEYESDPKTNPGISLKDSLTSARFLVEKFTNFANKWMKQNFDGHPPPFVYPHTPMVGIGIDRAHALFDYFGSADHRKFLAVGDRIAGIKTLATIAGTSEEFCKKPILLHHSAEKYARDVLENVHAFDLSIPGVVGPVRVYPVSEENIKLAPIPPR